jgi:HNH endonuclease
MTLRERFFAKVRKTSTCWLWTAACGKEGYGEFWLNGANVPAHRVSWILAFGSPGPKCVLHKCDNPPCVRPSHLFLGTKKQNMVDAARKMRMRHGERHHSAKLTREDVREIREKYIPHRYTLSTLSKEYGVSLQVVWDIVKYRIWKTVSGSSRKGAFRGSS